MKPWTPTLFLPGPVDVHPDVLAAAATPMIGHRSAAAAALLDELDHGLRPWLGVDSPVYALTCSATLAMEATVRNLVRRSLLVANGGVFADRWKIAAEASGRRVVSIDVPHHLGITPEVLEHALANHDVEAVALVAVETSTGVALDLDPLLDVCARHPHVLVLVDAVTAAGAMYVPGRRCDAVFTASQKALAMPPGLTFLALSERAIDRSRTMEGRGLYADFARVDRFHRAGGSPFTPALPVFFAAVAQIRRLHRESVDARFAAHRAKHRAWLERAARDFPTLCPFATSAPSVVVHASPRDVAPAEFVGRLAERHGLTVAPGVGPHASTTWRVGLLGDTTVADIHRVADAVADTAASF